MRFEVADSYIISSSKGNKKRHAPKENRAAGMMVEVHSKI